MVHANRLCKKKWDQEHPGQEIILRNLTSHLTHNPIHVSCSKHGKMKLHLLLETVTDNRVHCAIINDIERLASRCHCCKCHLFFKQHTDMKTHMQNSVCLTCCRYPGGTCVRQKILWEVLAEEGIDPETSLGDLSWPNRLRWDIESQCCGEKKKKSDKLFQVGVHKAVSIAVASDVPGTEGTFFPMPWIPGRSSKKHAIT